MIHTGIGDESFPIEFGEFSIHNIGECSFEIRPYEDDEKPPQIYVIAKDGREVCSIRLLEPTIIPSDGFYIGQAQKESIAEAINGTFDIPFLGKYNMPNWNMLTKLWLGFNGPEDEHIKFPNSPPDYSTMTEEIKK